MSQTALSTSSPATTSSQMAANSLRPRRHIALALQGGGAHGAFTWGVLDRLLDEQDLSIEAISGASAGALNAVALAAGFLQGGRKGAQQTLRDLWQRIAELGRMSPLQRTPMEHLTPNWRSDWSPAPLLFEALTRFLSPYQFNPFGIDPLRQILRDLIDFDALRRPEAIRLFIAATRIDSGALRLFANAELTVDAVLASGCLPALNQAIKLDDGYYWDGGYSANPALLPLIADATAPEILLVRVDPLQDETLPVTASGIRGRLNRIVVNAPLNAELRLLDWLHDQLAAPDLAASDFGQRLAGLKIHTLGADEVMRQLGNASKLTPDWTLLSRLHEVGRDAADHWLAGGRSPIERPTASAEQRPGRQIAAGRAAAEPQY
ncbi:MAG: patatin-like phospholipase family protein [Dongiaceae bacterium]